MKKPLITILSTEGLDAAVANIVRRRSQHTELAAKYDQAVADLQQERQQIAGPMLDVIASLEAAVQEYCTMHRAELFGPKKSRETTLAEFGFELTPPRVETSSKRVRWKDVLTRFARLAWAAAYVRQPELQVDKQALLADREKLTPEQCTAAGIEFCQDEQFYIRPKPATAKTPEAQL